MTAMVQGHHHNGHTHSHNHTHSPDDVDLLRALTASSLSASKKAAITAAAASTTAKRPSLSSNTRRPQLDPLILETAASSGPHVTRNHFLHEFYPHPEDPSSSFSHHHHYYTNGRSASKQAYASCDVGPESDVEQQKKSTLGKLQAQAQAQAQASRSSRSTTGFPRATVQDDDDAHVRYQSRQAPRKIRLEREKQELEEQERLLQQLQDGYADDNATTEDVDLHTSLKDLSPSPLLTNTAPTTTTPSPSTASASRRRRSSAAHSDPIQLPKILKASKPTSLQVPPSPTHPQLRVICHARTRVPTPHGEVYLHLYKNNMDDKEHLAFVFDRKQLEQQQDESVEPVRGTLRSKSLDAVWREGETDIERIVRGAYVGRLSSGSAIPSRPQEDKDGQEDEEEEANDEPVLIRVHSECFTGETIGSQRCDCGEQLDEAFRLISSPSSSGLGIIVYLRQEGRGIGLLEKIKAYNLQDLGHDTVSANLLLGHNADLRSYGIAGEILRDLSVKKVRLLTNNPDKIESVEKEGIKVVERVAMVPRGWGEPVVKHKSKKARKAGKSGSSSSKKKKKQDQLTKQNLLTSTTTPAAMAARPRNKNLELLHDGSQTPLSQMGITDDDEDEEGGSYHFPSAPGSRTSFSDGAAAEMDSSVVLENVLKTAQEGEEEEEEDDEDDDTSSSEDDEESEEARADFLMAMNRTGVGMIGAGTTHSKELEKYLKTKVERTGHLLVVPNAPPSTPIGGVGSSSSGKKRDKKSRKTLD